MAWKNEKWLSDIFPGEEKIYSAYRNLPPRELVIVGAGVLDSALAELISKRVVDTPKEYEPFLGVDGSAYAPCGSFSARIQLAVLMGIITPNDAKILRLIKDIRNKCAHHINIGFCKPPVLSLLRKLHSAYVPHAINLAEKNHWGAAVVKQNLLNVGKALDLESEAGEGLFLAVFVVYHAYFHRLSASIKRVDNDPLSWDKFKKPNFV